MDTAVSGYGRRGIDLWVLVSSGFYAHRAERGQSASVARCPRFARIRWRPARRRTRIHLAALQPQPQRRRTLAAATCAAAARHVLRYLEGRHAFHAHRARGAGLDCRRERRALRLFVRTVRYLDALDQRGQEHRRDRAASTPAFDRQIALGHQGRGDIALRHGIAGTSVAQPGRRVGGDRAHRDRDDRHDRGRIAGREARPQARPARRLAPPARTASTLAGAGAGSLVSTSPESAGRCRT